MWSTFYWAIRDISFIFVFWDYSGANSDDYGTVNAFATKLCEIRSIFCR